MVDVNTTVNHAKEIYELADLSLKLGLGALIGATASYFTVKSNHKHDITRIKLNKKMEILEEANILVETYFEHAFKLQDAWYGLALNGIHSLVDMTESKSNQYIEYDRNYHNSINTAVNALSKLTLLGLEEAQDYIQQYDYKVICIRNSIITNTGKIPHVDDMKKLTEETGNLRLKYHSAINKYFENLK